MKTVVTAALFVAIASSSCWAQAKPSAPDSAASVDWSKAQPVTVALTEYQFTPSELHFRVDVPYRLTIENRGNEIHDFTASEFFAAARLEDQQALAPYQVSIAVKPGEHKQVDFIATKTGRYPLRCADHDWAGMEGSIVVE